MSLPLSLRNWQWANFLPISPERKEMFEYLDPDVPGYWRVPVEISSRFLCLISSFLFNQFKRDHQLTLKKGSISPKLCLLMVSQFTCVCEEVKHLSSHSYIHCWNLGLWTNQQINFFVFFSFFFLFFYFYFFCFLFLILPSPWARTTSWLDILPPSASRTVRLLVEKDLSLLHLATCAINGCAWWRVSESISFSVTWMFLHLKPAIQYANSNGLPPKHLVQSLLGSWNALLELKEPWSLIVPC